MNLHKHEKDFRNLVSIVANKMNLPESAIARDYFIVLLLYNLSNSEYASKCVFKGGTSLSKCYPNSIERFSEDIDLTFLGMNEKNKSCDKNIKKIETIMTSGFKTEKISEERSERSKSMYVWFYNNEYIIKLEIGSNVKPDPYSIKVLKSYIHEYLEKTQPEYIQAYNLKSVTLNVLNIERTFIDKIMSVKRHALCGTLSSKVRHIYDVTKMYKLNEIQKFLNNKLELKKIVMLTKETDSYYLKKRNIPLEYNPIGKYDFDSFKKNFDNEIKSRYEKLHIDLLYTNEKQNFDEALKTFDEINKILLEIDE